MPALYFLSGVLVTSGIIMQSFDKGEGWSFAILFGVLVAVLTTTTKN